MTSRDDVVDTIECGHGVEIDIIHDPDPPNPRENDNFGTMVCWHGRYDLGDKHSHKDTDALLNFLLGDLGEKISDQEDEACNQWCDTHPKHTHEEYMQAMRDIDCIHKQMKWEALAKAGCIVLPLYLYDHSGITMSTGSFSCPWDSGQVGWIYATKEDILKNWMCKELTDEIKYPHDGTVKPASERAKDLLQAEVEEYDLYLTGQCYGYIIRTQDDGNVDSCWGFLGLDSVKEYAEAEAKEYVNQYADQSRMNGVDI